jgi:hypothetical protein
LAGFFYKSGADMAFNLKCPYCAHAITLGDQDSTTSISRIKIGTAKDDEYIGLKASAFKCPNPDCHKFSLEVAAGFGALKHTPNGYIFGGQFLGMTPAQPVGAGYFRFAPRVPIPLSAHVPATVRSDYDEACSIKDLSPKAAATLCRRALQGMIRDFHGITKPTLHEELNAIKGNCDGQLFAALMGIKSVGNIGAHPEKDINLIIDVEPGEVDALVEALQLLDEEWYVARAQRNAKLAKVHALSVAKAAEKNAPSAVALPAPQSEI